MLGLVKFGSRQCVVERGRHVLPVGARHESCLVLLDGMLSRQHFLGDGRSQVVGLHMCGDICGLQALYRDRADYELVAITAATYIPVDASYLLSAARNSQIVAKALLQAMLREMALADAWTVNLGQRSAYERMAHLICELETRLRLAGQDTSEGVEWPGTQADLGAITGLSAVHVNRTVQKLVADKLVSSGRSMIFRDFERLRVAAGFDPSYLSDHSGNFGEVLMSYLGAHDGRERGSDLSAPQQVSH